MASFPAEFAFAVIDPATHVRLSANRNPDFAWSGRCRRHAFARARLPRSRRAVARRRRQPGGARRAGVAAARRLLPLGADRPAARRARRSRAASSPTASRARGKPGPHAPRGARQGINDYTGWFAGDKDMARRLLRLRRPVPAVERRDPAPLRVHAVRARRAAARRRRQRSPAPTCASAMEGHVLAQASRHRALHAQSGGQAVERVARRGPASAGRCASAARRVPRRPASRSGPGFRTARICARGPLAQATRFRIARRATRRGATSCPDRRRRRARASTCRRGAGGQRHRAQ